MRQTSTTPGPWKAEDGFVFGANGLRVADCSCDDQPMPADEAVANARLIAAAPAVLEALDLAIRAMNAPPNFNTRLPDPERPQRSLSSYQLLSHLAAVARQARGRQPGDNL